GDLGSHLGQFLLLQLECTNGFSELNAFFTITQSNIVAIQCHPDSSPRNSVTSGVKTAQRCAQTVSTGKKVFFWNFYVVKNQLTGIACTKAPFAVHGRRCKSFHTALYNQTVNTAFFVFSPYHCNLSKWRIT